MDLIWRWRKKKFWRGLNLAISDQNCQNHQIFSTPKFVRIRYIHSHIYNIYIYMYVLCNIYCIYAYMYVLFKISCALNIPTA